MISPIADTLARYLPPNQVKALAELDNYGSSATWASDFLQFETPARVDPARPSMTRVPTAQTVEESRALFDQRRQATLEHDALQPLMDWFPRKGAKTPAGPAGGPLPNRANAKLALSMDVERVNRVLLDAEPYSNVGTDTDLILGIRRRGDYDFALSALGPVVYGYWNSGLLWPQTKQHLATTVMNQEGSKHMAGHWFLGIVPETENHILMTESARYLKNQLVHNYGLSYSTEHLKPREYDNNANGFNSWFVNHLSQFTRHDFDEYNSKPYQDYAMKPIQNLYEYAEDPKVKTSARIVLDYLAAKFAIQSSELRRSVPFRRRPEYLEHDSLLDDAQASRYAVLAGNFNPAYVDKFGDDHMVVPANGSYRVPDPILDLMVAKGHNPYFATAHHHNTEIVYSEENFLISAGGHYHDWSWLPFTNQENGLPVPTVVMLKGGSAKTSEMIRFLGRGDNDRINNTGVYENFAFGIRPVVPQGLEDRLAQQGKSIRGGGWTFMEMDGSYVALYRQSAGSPKNYAPSEGFLEIVDKKEFPTLESFRRRVEQLNPATSYRYYGLNRYTTTRGKTIDFVMADPLDGGDPPKPDKVNQWLVKYVWQNGQQVPIETNLDRWPLLSSHTLKRGDQGTDCDFVVRADGTGQILINNPYRKQSLLMSLADHNNPIRIEQNGEIVDLAGAARVSSQSSRYWRVTNMDLAAAEQVRYISLKWRKDSKPQHVKVYVLDEGAAQWRLAQQRDGLFSSDDYDFRTDFDLGPGKKVRSLYIVAEGKDLNAAGAPEVYRYNR